MKKIFCAALMLLCTMFVHASDWWWYEDNVVTDDCGNYVVVSEYDPGFNVNSSYVITMWFYNAQGEMVGYGCFSGRDKVNCYFHVYGSGKLTECYTKFEDPDPTTKFKNVAKAIISTKKRSSAGRLSERVFKSTVDVFDDFDDSGFGKLDW